MAAVTCLTPPTVLLLIDLLCYSTTAPMMLLAAAYSTAYGTCSSFHQAVQVVIQPQLTLSSTVVLPTNLLLRADTVGLCMCSLWS